MAGDFLGSGTMVVGFEHAGMMAWLRKVLKMRTSVIESAQPLSTHPGMLSGPAAFLGFTMSSVLHTSAGCRRSLTLSEPGGVSVGVVVLLSSNGLKKVLGTVS